MSLFKTERLSVIEIQSDDWQDTLVSDLFSLLSPNVVQFLPPDLQDIHSAQDFHLWLKQMQTQARIFVIHAKQNDQPIGMIYLSEHDSVGHLGYWLGEAFWGKGFAQELLQGLVVWAKQATQLKLLSGGVDHDNQASSHVLRKLGFQPASDSSGVSHYVYHMS
ncbi:MAG: GNAT family N-acetyltransferase [Gammaproteobacteria bacterium]|nr:GNAT family N-acetyltransferase [Gammaproteobacteria bacterium]